VVILETAVVTAEQVTKLLETAAAAAAAQAAIPETVVPVVNPVPLLVAALPGLAAAAAVAVGVTTTEPLTPAVQEVAVLGF
jgi:hypothetical protein